MTTSTGSQVWDVTTSDVSMTSDESMTNETQQFDAVIVCNG